MPSSGGNPGPACPVDLSRTIQVHDECRGASAQPGAGPAIPEQGHRSRSRRSAVALILLWTIVAVLLVGWGALARPKAGDHRLGGRFDVLDRRPAARMLTVWVHWEAPPGAVGWVAIESDRAWSAPGETYWRRRVHPGWNQLIWDDFSGFPADAPVRLRILDGRGRWSVAPATTSSIYTPGQLCSLRGLLAALLLGAGAAGLLLWRGLRSPEPAAPRLWRLALIALAGVALVLRLHTLTTQSFWFDEVLTAIGAQSFAWVLYSPEIFGHPPMQYLLGWAMGGAQATEGWLRAPFVAAGVVAVVGVGYLGRRLFGASTGLLAAGLLAVSPFHVELSQLARPYAFLVLGVVLSLLALFRALERGAAADWVCFSAVAALSLYTHYAAGFALLVEALVAATWVLRRRGEGGLRALVSFAAIAALLAPWAAVLSRVAGAQVGGGQVSVALLGEILTGAVVPQLIGPGLWEGVAGALILFGIWKLRRRPEAALTAVFSLTLPLAMLWATNPSHFLAGRHFAFVLPVVVLALAHGLVSAVSASGIAATRLLGSHRGWTRKAGAALAAVVLILAAGPPATASLGGYYRWRQGADWRTVASVLNRLVTPGDEVVATLGAVYPLRYYWGRAVTEVDGRGLWERYRRDPSGRRLWIVTLEGWDWAPELHHWLGAHAIEVGEVPPSWSLPRVYIHRAAGLYDERDPARPSVPSLRARAGARVHPGA